MNKIEKKYFKRIKLKKKTEYKKRKRGAVFGFLLRTQAIFIESTTSVAVVIQSQNPKIPLPLLVAQNHLPLFIFCKWAYNYGKVFGVPLY